MSSRRSNKAATQEKRQFRTEQLNSVKAAIERLKGAQRDRKATAIRRSALSSHVDGFYESLSVWFL